MNIENYRDIAPYRGEDFQKAKERLLSNKEYLASFLSLLAGDEGPEKLKAYLDGIFAGTERSNDY